MAIPHPAALVVTPATGFLTPIINVEPLGTALANTNHLYEYFTPPLASVMPNLATGLSRNTSYIFGIIPSQDGLRYLFDHTIYPVATGVITIKVESGHNDGPTVWTPVLAATAYGTVAGTWVTISHYGTVAATEDRIRVTYSAASGNYLPSQILIYPAPDPTLKPFAAPWIVTSGFRVYEDSLLDGGATLRPVTTEMLDRCRRNSIRVLTDRVHNVFSYVQEDGALGTPLHVAPFASLPAEGWATVGRARAQIGRESKATLQVRVLASVSAGTTVDRVWLSTINDEGVLMDATVGAPGAMVSESLVVHPDASGFVDFSLSLRASAGNTCTIHSAMAFWRPGS